MDVDLIVIGMGPGGEDVAGTVAAAGRSVLGLDERLLGGECPYFGCIPSKMILRGADVIGEARRLDAIAGSAVVTPDFTPVADRIRDEATTDWDDASAVERFEGKGGTFLRARGRLAGRRDDGRLLVGADGAMHSAAAVVIATGTSPVVPPIPGLADLYAAPSDDEPKPDPDGLVWTNREALRTRSVPDSLIVIGGGAIGCELAQGFARYGARVSIVDGAPHLLAKEEQEAGEVVADVFRREGLGVHVGVGVSSVASGGEGVVVTLADGTELTAAKLLVATGRRTNLDVGLDTLSLDARPVVLDVDEHMRVLAGGTPVEGLYAIGDVTGRAPFTHVSMWQSGVVSAHLLGRDEPFGGYHGVAWATFTDPEVGHVGLTEAAAREGGGSVRVGVAQISSDTRGWIHGPGNDGFVKLVEDVDRGVLVGATVVSPYGGELLGMLTLAVHAEVPVHTLATMHYAFPTLHRTVLEALRTLS